MLIHRPKITDRRYTVTDLTLKCVGNNMEQKTILVTFESGRKSQIDVSSTASGYNKQIIDKINMKIKEIDVLNNIGKLKHIFEMEEPQSVINKLNEYINENSAINVDGINGIAGSEIKSIEILDDI